MAFVSRAYQPLLSSASQQHLKSNPFFLSVVGSHNFLIWSLVHLPHVIWVDKSTYVMKQNKFLHFLWWLLSLILSTLSTPIWVVTFTPFHDMWPPANPHVHVWVHFLYKMYGGKFPFQIFPNSLFTFGKWAFFRLHF